MLAFSRSYHSCAMRFCYLLTMEIVLTFRACRVLLSFWPSLSIKPILMFVFLIITILRESIIFISRQILYSYLVGCCPISDLFVKREPILGEAKAELITSSEVPNKSDIGQITDQTIGSFFLPKILVHVSLIIMRSNYKLVHPAQLNKSSFNSQTF